MTTIKEISFPDKYAYHMWLKENKSEVVVLEQSDILNEFGYEASSRLDRPRIFIKYIDFREY